jgi:ferritin-like metal-binding protein YciE
MNSGALYDLMLDELKDLYNAENQLVKALPKMAKASSAPDLTTAFQEHIEQTHEHVERLDRIFEQLGVSPRGKKCHAMEGLIEEGKELIDADLQETAKDAGIIGAAQKVEHYEIAGYGTARAHAQRLGMHEVVQLLEETLAEEKQADAKLTHLAEAINHAAQDEEPSQHEAADGRTGGSRAKTNARR